MKTKNRKDGRRKLPLDWTPERMLLLWEAGVSYAAIARMTGAGVCRHAILYHIRKALEKRATARFRTLPDGGKAP